MPQATISEHVLFYDDVDSPSNPQRKIVDWTRVSSGFAFDEVRSQRLLLPPDASNTLVSAVGALDLSASSVTAAAGVLKTTWYVFRGLSAGNWALPLAVAAQSTTLTINSDGVTATLSGAGLAALTAVQPGDWVYLAGSGYGDAGAWSPTNQGFWKVLSLNTGLVLSRVYPEDSMLAETVVMAGTGDIQHLPDATRPRWLFARGLATYAGLRSVLGAGIGWLAVAAEPQFVPGTGLTFSVLISTPRYIAYCRIESDLPITVQVGDVGATVNEVSLQPLVNGTPVWYECFSFATSLAVKNEGSYQTATVNLVYALSQE